MHAADDLLMIAALERTIAGVGACFLTTTKIAAALNRARILYMRCGAALRLDTRHRRLHCYGRVWRFGPRGCGNR